MFFFIALGSSWIYEAIVFGLLHKTSLNPWLGPATFGPTLAAFLTLAVTQGRPGIGRLLRRYVLWKVPLRWYLVALAGPALIVLAALLASGSAPRLPSPASFGGFMVLNFGILLIAGGPLGEEPGWRGFALPLLQRRAGALWGTLVLAGFWILWHVPLFVLVPGYDGSGSGLTGIALPFVGFALALASSAVIFTWVFNNTRGSLLLAILLHASFNAFFSQSNRWLLAGAWLVIAAIVVAATRGRLSYGREELDL